MTANLIDHPQFRHWLTYVKNLGWASIAFAGTTKGMTPGQRAALKDIFRVTLEHVDKWQFHHEDFPGADIEAHELALVQKPPAVVVLHPVVFDFRARGTTGFAVEREVQPKGMRYAEMINESHVLIVAPSSKSGANFEMIKLYAKKARIGTITLPVEQRPLTLRERERAVAEFRREHPNQEIPDLSKFYGN